LLTHLLNLLASLLQRIPQKATLPPAPPKTLVEILTPENIRSYFTHQKYTFFDTPEKKLNINIIGVRRDNQGTNTFDDYMLVMYRDGKNMVHHCYPITTDPGKYWLLNPSNPKGTAILAPGQYPGGWQLGKHQGKYEALVQRKPVKVYRDNTKDEIIDYGSMTTLIDEGYFGINIHRSNPYDESYVVNRWSAGCQVFKRIEDYNKFMEICKASANIYGNGFTYTLIHEKDLRHHLNQ